jgi:ABC-type cobalamin/Fe3+-siderophores transport system ATPase subunit
VRGTPSWSYCTIWGSPPRTRTGSRAFLRAGTVAADGAPEEVFEERLLSEVYDQPVEVFPHPRTGALLVNPERNL